MKNNFKTVEAFTLVDMLVVIVVIAILAALLLPVLSAAKRKAQQTDCLNNLRQINLGVRMYSDEANDSAPALERGQTIWFRYRELLQSYLGLKNPPSPSDKVFACPADTFFYRLNGTMNYIPQGHYEQSYYDYSSYEFNGSNQSTNTGLLLLGIKTGIAGRKLTTIKHPERTILVAEASAFLPYSWHQPQSPINGPRGLVPTFNNAKNVAGFVDGHVSYIAIYWDSSTNSAGYSSFSFFYDPPAGYDYKWSGD